MLNFKLNVGTLKFLNSNALAQNPITVIMEQMDAILMIYKLKKKFFLLNKYEIYRQDPLNLKIGHSIFYDLASKFLILGSLNTLLHKIINSTIVSTMRLFFSNKNLNTLSCFFFFSITSLYLIRLNVTIEYNGIRELGNMIFRNLSSCFLNLYLRVVTRYLIST